MPGRYHPNSHRHGGGGGGRADQRTGNGIPTNINAGPADSNPHHGVGGGAAGGSIGNLGNPHPPNLLSPEALSLAHLRQKSISHPMQQCQLTIFVPPHTVGAVIGRGGRTILNVQREAMRRSAGHVAPVRISVLGSNSSNSNNSGQGNANGHANQQQQQHEAAHANQGDAFPSQQRGHPSSTTWNYREYLTQQQQLTQPGDANRPGESPPGEADDDSDDWTPVIIRGDPVGCFAAVRQILPLVDHAHDRHVVLEVPVHRANHNTLVGKGGVTIAALSAAHEARIMIPPNEFMSTAPSRGGENFWKKRAAHNEGMNAGSALLFGDGGGGGVGGHGVPMSSGAGGPQQQLGRPGTLPPNIIQLEGEIDRIERCLVRMLSIVAGERWIPSGVIVKKPEVPATAAGGGSKGARDAATAPNGGTSSASSGTTAGKGGKEGKEGATTAEAVIVKIWTPSSKLLNLGKIRKVQRKTNTVIRRKKLRLSGSHVDGGIAGAREEDVADDEGGELPSLVHEGGEDEEDGVPREVSFAGESFGGESGVLSPSSE